MAEFWGWTTIAGLGLAALLHSWFGERMLIGPLLHSRAHPLLQRPLPRLILRGGWHVASSAWLLIAWLLALALLRAPGLAPLAFGATGVLFTLLGLADLVLSRARHIGWPALVLIGLAALACSLSL